MDGQVAVRDAGTAPWRGWHVLACLPALLLCGAMLAGILNGAGPFVPGGVAAWARHALPVAGGATLVSLALGAPLAAAGAGRAWLVLWLVPAACVAGWPLLPIPEDAAAGVLRGAVLTAPVTVLALSSAWAGLPRGISRAAAAAGAGPLQRLRLRLRLALPGIVWASAVVGALCLGLSSLHPAAS